MGKIRVGVVFGAAALLLAACSSSSSSSSGAASSSGSASKSPYTFGVVDATTGTYGVVGVDELNGIKLAVNQINAAGGVDGHPLAYTLADDQGSVSLSTVAMKRFALQDKYPVVMGPGITPPAEADAPLAQQYGVLNMNFVAQSVTWQGRSHVFAMVTPQASLADAMLKYMANVNHVTSAYILNANVVFGNLGQQLLAQDASKYGITITGKNTWDVTQADFTAQADAVAAANPPGVFLWGAGANSDGLVLKALRTAGYKGKIVGDVTYSEQDIFTDGGQAATTVVGMSQINYANPNTITKNFIDAFKAAYGHLPDYLAGATYDTVYILKNAILKAGAYNANALVTALNSLSYDGVNGSYAFSPSYHGGPGAGSYVAITFDAQGNYTLAPS